MARSALSTRLRGKARLTADPALGSAPWTGRCRAVLVIDVENPASERVAARCGYTREGVSLSGEENAAGRQHEAERVPLDDPVQLVPCGAERIVRDRGE
jgi:hypothetical protein